MGDQSSIPGLGRSPEEENGNPLQYSCLEKPMDRGAWKAIVHRVTKSQTQLKRLKHANQEYIPNDKKNPNVILDHLQSLHKPV